MQRGRSPRQFPCISSCRLGRVLGVLITLGYVAAGCSSDNNPANRVDDAPAPVSSWYVALRGLVPQAGDIVGIQFNRTVYLEGPSVVGFIFQNASDTFGDGAILSQSVVGSDRVEITLGLDPILAPGDPGAPAVSRVNVANAGSGVVEVVGTNGIRAKGKFFVAVEDLTDTDPVLLAASLVDSDSDGLLDRGDQIVASFDKPIAVPDGATVEDNFEFPVTGDSFGTGASLLAASTLSTNRVALIRLGDDPVITEPGAFSDTLTDPGSPSGLRVAVARTITDTAFTGPHLAEPGATVDIAGQRASLPGNGRPASNVLGTPDALTSWLTSQGVDDPSGEDLFSGELVVENVPFAEDLLFVADRQNDRVLVFRGVPGGNFVAASWVLGQPDFTTATTDDPFDPEVPSPTAFNMNKPSGLAFDAARNRLYVADTGYHRVLVFLDLFFLDPTTGDLQVSDGREADFAIGQASLQEGKPNRGQSTPSALTLSAPGGLGLSGNNFAVADTGNHRVLLFATSPSSPAVLPTVALGQADFNSGEANRGGTADASTLSAPESVFVSPNFNVNGSSGAVLVTDTGNNRTLVWESTSPLLGAPADVVLGQPDMTTTTPGVSSTALDSPTGVVGDLDTLRIYVADRDNSRVMTYDASGGIADGAAGEAIGQATTDDGDSNRGGEPGAQTLSYPERVDIAGTNLVVSDTKNHRLLGYLGDSLPDTHQNAELVLGQLDFDAGTPNAKRYKLPTDAILLDGMLIVADTGNHRILIYNNVPVTGDPDPDVVLGQQTLNETRPNQGGPVSAATLSLPSYVATDGVSLAVGDTGNNRVLVWATVPDISGSPADVILGQATEGGSAPNAGGAPGASTLSGPQGLAAAQDAFLVADTGNHRVLIFDALSALAGFDEARVVLGQRNFTETAPNRGLTVSGTTLNGPRDVLYGANRVYVADTENHRVLVWNGVPRRNGDLATGWYGQGSLSSAVVAPPASQTLLGPAGLSMDVGAAILVISDTENHRVLFYEEVGGDSRLARSADSVLGQVDLLRGDPNQGFDTPSAETLRSPRGVFWNGYDTVSADSGNSRATLYR